MKLYVLDRIFDFLTKLIIVVTVLYVGSRLEKLIQHDKQIGEIAQKISKQNQITINQIMEKISSRDDVIQQLRSELKNHNEFP